jgi:hypothetical protein
MRKTLLLSLIIVFGWAFLAFMMDDDQRPRRSLDNRVSVERVLEATNLNFSKEIGQTSIIFQFVPEDSIKIECEDCILRMGNAGDKGFLGMSMQSIDGMTKLSPASFNRWIRINSTNGKVGIVFERDGVGEKVLTIRSIKVLRKTRSPFLDVGGEPMGLLDVNNLYIDKLTKDNTETQTTFFFKLKSEDKLKVDIIGANGAVPANLVCSMYKSGEEYDKKPIATGSELPVPLIDGGQDRFGFEFGHIKDVKGVNAYHLDIYRIPLHSSGYRSILDTSKVDSLLPPEDTVQKKDPNEMLLKYLESLKGPRTFSCTTIEGAIATSVPSKFHLGMNRRNRVCFDIPLTDDCVGDETCIGCDTLWSFWIGAGENLINRYKFQDSLRRMKKNEGLIEGYAKAKSYSGMRGNGAFPDPSYGEPIFFAIVDVAEKARFLDQALYPEDWYGDGSHTFSPGAYVTSAQTMLRYSPGRALSVCICNDNSMSTVPVMFKFQQFLTDPSPQDTAKSATDLTGGSLYEIDPTEAP